MADLGNQKIKDTYQLVLQTDASGNLQNLTGGTPTPLIINGTLRYTVGTPTDGYILTSDGSGNASWAENSHASTLWSANTDSSISPSGLTTNIGLGTYTPNKPLTVVGDISGTTDLYIDENMYSGTTNLLDIFASSAITNQDVYWSANTGTNNTGISPSGTSTDVRVSGDTYIAGTGILQGSLGVSGITTSTGGFVGDITGDVTGNADTVTNGVYTTNNLSVMASTSSAQLAGVISNETGTGSLVFNTSPELDTPTVITPSTRFTESDSTVFGGTGGADIVVEFGTNSSTIAGDIYYYTTSGTWEPAEAGAPETSIGLLGVAVNTNSQDGMILRGMVTMLTLTPSIGLPIYLSEVAGDGTPTAPTTDGAVVRVIGYSINAARTQMWFNPDNTWVELS